MKSSILDPNNLQIFAKEHKLQPFRVKQILQEIYDNHNIKFEDMTTLSKDLREELDKNFEILSLTPETILESEDIERRYENSKSSEDFQTSNLSPRRGDNIKI